MKSSTLLAGAALASSMLLAACGGGDSDSNATALAALIPAPTPPTPTAEGFYATTTTNAAGYDIATVVLENNEFYIIYVNSRTYDLGMVYGAGTPRSGSFSASGATDYNFATLTKSPATLSATYAAKTSFNGSVSGQVRTISFAASYDPLYEKPASLANVAGIYALVTASGSGDTPARMSLAPSGAMTGTFPVGTGTCKFNGTLAPRPSGKNVFNMNVTYQGAPCPLGTSTASGIAVAGTQGGVTALFAAGALADGSTAVVAVGRKM